MIKPLKLEDFLNDEEVERFHEEWESGKRKLPLAEPYEVHSAMPVISKAWQFEDKPIFRARVLQKRLRETNPYHNARCHLMPIWHPIHVGEVAEQMWHVNKKLSVPNYNRTAVYEAPQIELRAPIRWETNDANGNISVIALYKLMRGSWADGNSIEIGTWLFFDDKKQQFEKAKYYANCFASWRSYVKAYRNLQEGKPDALKRMRNLILDQSSQHKRLLNPRTDLRENEAEELIEKCKNKTLTLEELDHFFSLYNLPNFPKPKTLKTLSSPSF